MVVLVLEFSNAGDSLTAAAGHTMDREEAAASTRRSGGGSLWSGLKQMFHPRPQAQGGPQPPQRPARGSSSTLSYSCLGNSRRAAEDADPYGGGAQPAQLNRNMSYSHESVFQMDPHIVQVSDILSFYYIFVKGKKFS